MGDLPVTGFAIIESMGANDCFLEALTGVLKEGSKVVSRGMETREVRPAIVIFLDPRQRFLTCPGRLIHPYFQVMEFIWILAGRGDVAWISKYLGNMEKYSDGKAEFHGSYGHRMRRVNYNRSFVLDNMGMGDQFKNCYEYLSKEPDTRHAVMSFWSPVFDHHTVETNDRPCNITFQFLIREGKLDLTIFNRSNDLLWGLFNTNVVQFSVILETMAMLLGIPVGKQIHMSNSLHVYTNNPNAEELFCAGDDLVSRILNKCPKDKDGNFDYKSSFNVYDYVEPEPFKLDVFESEYSLTVLDSDLERFFREEEIIWGSGNYSFLSPYKFSFLQDAICLTKSFYHYKNRDYINAIYSLESLIADDIFISCMEFLARKAVESKELACIDELLADRFDYPKCDVEKIKAINNYIFGH